MSPAVSWPVFLRCWTSFVEGETPLWKVASLCSSLVSFASHCSCSVGIASPLSSLVMVVSQGSMNVTGGGRRLVGRTEGSESETGTCDDIWSCVVIVIDYCVFPFYPLSHGGAGGWVSGSRNYFHVCLSGDDAERFLQGGRMKAWLLYLQSLARVLSHHPTQGTMFAEVCSSQGEGWCSGVRSSPSY